MPITAEVLDLSILIVLVVPVLSQGYLIVLAVGPSHTAIIGRMPVCGVQVNRQQTAPMEIFD